MLVIQIDVIHAEPRERRGALFLHEFGVTAHASGGRAELGREEDLAPLASALEPGERLGIRILGNDESGTTGSTIFR